MICIKNLTLGKDADKKDMGRSLIDAYGYYPRALPYGHNKGKSLRARLRSRPNTPEMLKTIASNYANYYNAGALPFGKRRMLPVLMKRGRYIPIYPS